MSTDLPGMANHPIGDKPARQRFIARSIWFTVPGTFLVLGLAYALLPPLQGMDSAVARLLLAVRWLLVAVVPYAAVCLVILSDRFFEGAHDPLAGAESLRLKIHCRVMQNSLEQLAWFALCILPLATMLTGAQAHFIPVACVFFAFARFVYWGGYLRDGTLGRAPGVQLTFSLNVLLLVLALELFARQLAS